MAYHSGYVGWRRWRINCAEKTDGFDMPSFTFLRHRIGRIVMAGPDAGFHHRSSATCARLDREAQAREKRQNRSLPK